MSTRHDFFSARAVRGRSSYVCAGCREVLAKGAEHVCVSACSAGEVWSKRYCSGCAAEAGLVVEARGGRAADAVGVAGRAVEVLA